MSNIAINVENLSKLYRIGTLNKQHDTFVGMIGALVKKPFTNLKNLKNLTKINSSSDKDLIKALNNVSFKVEKGDVFGIIGSNGAGKSTLLKVLAKITHPSSGIITINGRVASLLEVGTGFHPELTGRENIYLNGTILGMTKSEINRKFSTIVEFSGIDKFIDTVVKRYSSGMRLRLAFSVAAHLDPEILLIDEVLAVGDADFQKKCLGKMQDISKEGRTVLFVSHNMTAIKSLCKSAIVLKKGAIVHRDSATDAVDFYLKQNQDKKPCIEWDISNAPGTDKLKILGVKISPVIGNAITVASGIKFQFKCFTSLERSAVDVTFELYTYDGVRLTHHGSLISEPKALVPGKYIVTVELQPFILNKGNFNLKVWYGLSGREKIAQVKEMIPFEVISAPVDKITKELPGVIRPKFSYHTKFIKNKAR